MFEEDFFPLKVVPDWFVTREGLYMWHDEDYWYHDDEITEWYDGYKKRKAQKARIKTKLMRVARHPDCVMDWGMSEEEKRLWK